MTLARISMKAAETQIDKVQALKADYHPHGKRSNAHFAEMLLFKARWLFDLKRHSEALSVFSTFKAWDPCNILKLWLAVRRQLVGRSLVVSQAKIAEARTRREVTK